MNSLKNRKIVSRPPVVTFMGHIDHGKTSLLDKIRQTSVQKKEEGGITQNISACQIEWQGQKITFIDTPGHEVFTKMRLRGAKITDVAVLVIAANEGVMPQTEESLKHIKQAKVPFLIALNKIDLPQSQLEKVKDQLLRLGVLVEDRGGEVVLVPVSAQTGKGINTLLEMIILLAQMNESKVIANASFEGVVLEALMNSSRGAEILILIREGELRVGEEISCGQRQAKVRAMFDWQGRSLKEAVVSQPVRVLGFKTPPPVGSIIKKVKTSAKKSAISLDKAQKVSPSLKKKSGCLSLILKGDSLGSKEAILDSLSLKNINILSAGVGDINESDVLLAASFGALVLGFNVHVDGNVRDLAKREGVSIKTFKIIYDFLQFVDKKVAKFLKEREEKEILGEAEIVAIFSIGEQKVAGCKVKRGVIKDRAAVQIWHQGKLVGKTKIVSLRIGKKNVLSVKKDGELGAVFSPRLDFAVGDMVRYIKSDSNNFKG